MLKYGFIIFIIWYIWSRKAKIPQVVNYLLAALAIVYVGIAINTIIKFLQ